MNRTIRRHVERMSCTSNCTPMWKTGAEPSPYCSMDQSRPSASWSTRSIFRQSKSERGANTAARLATPGRARQLVEASRGHLSDVLPLADRPPCRVAPPPPARALSPQLSVTSKRHTERHAQAKKRHAGVMATSQFRISCEAAPLLDQPLVHSCPVGL